MTQILALIDYGAGNIRSITNALIEAGVRSGAPVDVRLTQDPDAILRADRVVLPGVGAFRSCREGLDAAGVIEAMTEAVRGRGKPFLGVCVGLQLLATRGLEHGETAGLDWIAGEVRKLDVSGEALKLPHMGWNRVEAVRPHPVTDVVAGRDLYFVHSYALTLDDPADALLACDHGRPFTAAAARDNVLGVQFHPEKSQAAGLALLGAWLRWTP